MSTSRGRRSPEPLFWALFGAGGMLAALIAPGLILATGFLWPHGWLGAASYDHGRVLAVVAHPLGRVVVGTVIMLFLWHGAHRIVHGAHDLGYRARGPARWIGYGAAALGSAVTVALLATL